MVDDRNCFHYPDEINQVGRMWDKDGTRLYPLIDRAVRSLSVCQVATDPRDAADLHAVAQDLSAWIEEHRGHLAAMADLVSVMVSNSAYCLETGRWPESCGKGGNGDSQGSIV